MVPYRLQTNLDLLLTDPLPPCLLLPGLPKLEHLPPLVWLLPDLRVPCLLHPVHLLLPAELLISELLPCMLLLAELLLPVLLLRALLLLRRLLSAVPHGLAAEVEEVQSQQMPRKSFSSELTSDNTSNVSDTGASANNL